MKTVAERKREIYNLLNDSTIKTVVLYGEPGVGKTWTAREVSNVARREGLFDIVLWVYLKREYDVDTLRDSIAQQLSLFSTRGVSEVEDEDEELKEEELKPRPLVNEIENRKLLIVIDGESKELEELKVWALLKNLLELNTKTYKVLVTTRHDYTDIEGGGTPYRVDPMERIESLSLFKERAFSDHELVGVDSLAAEFIQRTEDMPNAIIMMAKAFKYFCTKEKGGFPLLRRSLEEPYDGKTYNLVDLLCSGYDLVPYSLLIDCQRDTKSEDKPSFNHSRCINHNELIAYWIMEGYLGPVSCMETVYRKGHEILMELLDFQILERVEADCVTINPLGVFSPQIGKNPLREEFDNFILRRESNFYRRGYYANAHLGLDSVFGSVKWKGFVRISHKGGVMKTLPGDKKVSVLLLDGNSLAKDLPSKFITSLKVLQVLVIFNPTIDMLSRLDQMLSCLDHIFGLLHVFVLRNCRYMKNIDRVLRIKNFENLTVLEISGPVDSENTEGSSSIINFPENFFTRMLKLQSLNLSSLPLTKLPPSVYELGELKWLILRDCTSLRSLNTLKNCRSLVVLDCSGSTSLEKIQDKRFNNSDLEMINFSNTMIKVLPLVTNLKKLTHLLLSKCSSLNRLRSISSMSSIEVIDLSSAANFHEFFDKSLEKLGKLKVLDLSGTRVRSLPGNVGNPLHLCLEGCNQLRGTGVPECLVHISGLERFVLSDAGIYSLPPISHLTNLRQLSVTRCLELEVVPDLSSLKNLEELDLSGCKRIKSILDKTFDKMYRLNLLNLSGTSISSLPSLANLSKLRRLLLKDCEELEALPSLESKYLEKLEELNINGGKALKNIVANFFDGSVNLRIIDLSETPLDKLTFLSKLENLRELYLRNCKGLKSIPDLESLTTLEILDLSGSAVSTLPSLSNLSRLRQLMLMNCSSLSLFGEMGAHNVLGDSVQYLPYGISQLISLERLDLPSMDYIQGVDSKELKPDSMGTNSKAANLNETKTTEAKSEGCEWGISSLSSSKEKRPSVNVSGTQFLQRLEKDPSLWESMLKKFHLCVYPIKELDVKRVLNFHGDDFVYRDIYLQSRHISEPDDQRLLQIYGFQDYKPEGIDLVFNNANQYFFVDNKFQAHKPATERNEEDSALVLQSYLTACNSKQIKGCWIEKCSDIEVIFSEKEIGSILYLLNSVETLWVSNTRSLKSIFKVLEDGGSGKEILKDGESDKEMAENGESRKEITESGGSGKEISDDLKESQDCEIFQTLEKLYLECCPKLSTVLSFSQLPPKLKILQIKFCDKLGKVFDLRSREAKLQYLETLYLWELPELKSIGCRLPSLTTLNISNCPNLEKSEEIIKSAQSLQNLSISNVHNLETICVSKYLKYLRIDSCPNLLKITSSLPPSDLDIQISFCNKLEIVFEEGTSSAIKFKRLYLHGLPKLRCIEATLPNQSSCFIVDCLNLKSKTMHKNRI